LKQTQATTAAQSSAETDCSLLSAKCTCASTDEVQISGGENTRN